MMKLKIVMESSDEGGYPVTVPSLLGCIRYPAQTLKKIKLYASAGITFRIEAGARA